MQSFTSMVGGSAEEIKDIRVKNATRIIESESRMNIDRDKQEYRKLQNSLESSLDLGITNTTDVATNLKNLDAASILKEVNETAQSMAILARQIKIAVKIHNTLFPENKVEDLSDEELDFLKDCI